MSWHFSVALEAEFSEGNSLDGELSAPLKSINSVSSDLCKDKMKDISLPSPFGMMYVPSTENHGKDLLTWYREVFLVKILAQQIIKPKESQENEVDRSEERRVGKECRSR